MTVVIVCNTGGSVTVVGVFYSGGGVLQSW